VNVHALWLEAIQDVSLHIIHNVAKRTIYVQLPQKIEKSSQGVMLPEARVIIARISV
jgi:hypothetical protein